MKQNGNKIRYMKYKSSLKLAAAVLAVSLAFPMAAQAKAWDFENGSYVDASGAPVEGAVAKGITVTKYQNRANKENGIDWGKVAADGVGFAMIRIGYYKDRDPYFERNITEAAAHDIKTGVFFYTQALDAQTAADEAEYVLQVIKDFPVSYPVAYDVESNYLLEQGLSAAQITENVNAFCKVIADAGYCPIVYIWYARYGTVNSYPNRTIWQCTQEGNVDGINDHVTIELSFTDYSSKIPANSWKKIDGRWYYMKDYVKQTGWVQVGDNWYYMDANGAMVSNTEMVIDGRTYRFAANGAMMY